MSEGVLYTVIKAPYFGYMNTFGYAFSLWSSVLLFSTCTNRRSQFNILPISNTVVITQTFCSITPHKVDLEINLAALKANPQSVSENNVLHLTGSNI